MFLAIALSMLVMIGFYMVFPPPQPPTPPPQPAHEEKETGAAPQPGAVESAGATEGSGPMTPAPEEAERLIRVDTPKYVAQISTRGGELVSFRLKDYAVAVRHVNWGDAIGFLKEIPYLGGLLAKNAVDPDARVEMVRRELAGPGALGIGFRDLDGLTAALGTASFRPDREAIQLTRESAPETLVLTGRTASGLTVRKSLTFDPAVYVLRYGASVINYGESEVTLRVQQWFGEGPLPVSGSGQAYGHVGPIFRSEGKVDTEDPDDVAPRMLLNSADWIGLGEPYFLSAARNESTIDHALYEAEERPAPGGKTQWVARYGMELPEVVLGPNKQIESAFRLYLGPKEEAEMEKFGDGLEESLDMTLEALARPLLAMMRWFYGFSGNYGVAIILLTIVVRVALFPLTYKGMVSIKRMQKLQPKMMAVREKYKNDRDKMNREMMGLYKRYKVNPLGGCLPILLQLPIFFALYSALSSAIELRHAPFAGWLTDLSAMDGLFVLPILMGASMVIQQRMTPTTADPVQAKILQWMPVIFTLFMFTFPSGLTLYWLTSNILSIAQQFVINRIKVPEPVEQG
jgi:YidC/Oxa1 family membrane protein insertase